MISRIEVQHDPELDAFGSFQQRTQVEVLLKDGRAFSTTGVLRGSAGEQVSRRDVVEKFHKVTRGFLSDGARAELVAACDGLETLPSLTELTRLLADAPR